MTIVQKLSDIAFTSLIVPFEKLYNFFSQPVYSFLGMNSNDLDLLGAVVSGDMWGAIWEAIKAPFKGNSLNNSLGFILQGLGFDLSVPLYEFLLINMGLLLSFFMVFRFVQMLGVRQYL